jgi:hypothetical protein
MPTVQQGRDGLNQSMYIRTHRGEARRNIAQLPLSDARSVLADLLEENPDWLATAFIDVVLLWPRRMHHDQAWHLIWSIGCHKRRAVGELSDRQRALLIGYLRGA